MLFGLLSLLLFDVRDALFEKSDEKMSRERRRHKINAIFGSTSQK